MNLVRPAAVAGMFYDADPDILRRDVAGFLEHSVDPDDTSLVSPKALIAPHAGYVYSGAVAGSAYATVRSAGPRIKRVVLLGPAHRTYTPGIAASSAAAFATPLGTVPIDRQTLRALPGEFEFVHVHDAAHVMEHSLEVQLPFLQAICPDFTLLPFAVGDAEPAQVELLLERLWGEDDTLIVISSDLSHYRPYAAAREIDAFTSREIRTLAPGRLTGEHACGFIPIGGLLHAVARRGLSCEVLATCNSGDTAGPRDRVVGYGAYAFRSR